MSSLNDSSSDHRQGAALVRAVIVLQDPPQPCRLEDWFLKPISGVPFLLRNILNLQRAGIDHLTVFHPQFASDEITSCFRKLSEDRRVSLDLHWEHEKSSAVDALAHPDCRLVLNGNALHRRNEIELVLSEENRSTAYKLERTEIESLLTENRWGESEFFSRNQTGEGQATLHVMRGSGDQWVTKRRDFRRQSESLLNESGLSNDSLLDRKITRHISRQVTRLFLLTPLTPNQITFIAMCVGLISACCFWKGGYEAGLAGAILLLVSTWIDCADGEVARLRFQESPLGGILDIWADNVVHVAVFFSMGIGLYFSTGDEIYKYFGAFAVLGTVASFALMQSTIVKGKTQATQGALKDEESSLADHLANRDFSYFLFILALMNQLDLFLALTAVGSILFSLWLAFQRYRHNLTANWCPKN